MLADLYLVTAAIGFTYVVGTSLLGFLNSSDAGSGDGRAQGDGGGDGSGFGADTGDTGGLNADSGNVGAGDGGCDFGGDGSAGDVGGDFAGDGGAGDVGGEFGGDTGAMAQAGGKFNAGILARKRGRRINPTLLFLKLISPSTVTTFGFFFGLTGYFALRYFPDLGNFSLIPAFFCGWLGYSATSAMTGAITSRMHVSTAFTETQVIGSVAEVTVPVSNGRTGEITYVVNAVRNTAPARTTNGKLSFKTSSHVIITDIKDGIAYVDECPEDLLSNEKR